MQQSSVGKVFEAMSFINPAKETGNHNCQRPMVPERQIFRRLLPSEQNSIDISALSYGVYFYESGWESSSKNKINVVEIKSRGLQGAFTVNLNKQ